MGAPGHSKDVVYGLNSVVIYIYIYKCLGMLIQNKNIHKIILILTHQIQMVQQVFHCGIKGYFKHIHT